MLPLPRGAVWQLLFLLCAVLYINGVRADGRVVCYYTNWSVYRPGTAKFNPQNINPYLCTHLIYAFGGFTKDNQMKPFDKYQDIEQGGYAKFTGLKTYNKQLKTMIAIGGWNEASSRFSPLVANPERRQKFIKNILKFLRQNHFDGIDLDWEYPAHREGGKPRDRDNYAQFVQELRAEFERESEKTGRPRLLLTMAVPAGIEYIEKGYDIPKLNKYLDWFNLLTYDFHSSHEPSVNHHAPLYSLEEESEYNYDAELNIDYSVKFYLNAGADRDKLVLGIPTYGRSYTLINEESTEIGAPAEAPGEQGDATREKGYLAYYEICQNIKEDPEWTVVQPNPNAMGPYAYRRNQWVGYDDEAIVRKKAQYVVENGLGGIMFWAIDNDDFRGTCAGKPYPLIEAAKEAMLDALGLGINEVSKPSAPQKPSRSRSRENSSSTRNRITTTEHKLTYAERKGSSKRTQVAQQTTRRQQPSSTSAPTTIKLTEAEGSSLYIGGRTTTPPPPTTPDPGTDFKCEEEGFFQHPRDCKKYYWCLDSGPSGLGIVAHMFTCPSGLYFNPAADSCDFARNVPCKTKKSTTAAPVTSTTTTTARPTSSYNRITAATSRPTTFFRTTPRTTTTEAPEEDFEYEEEDDNVPSPFAKPKGFDKDSEEDPKVIKELIELIRKVGGIEELEKHLLRKDDGTISIKESSSSSSSSSVTATTPSTISKSLYEKVLSKPNALNSFRNRFTSSSSFRTTKTQIKTQDNTETESDETRETDNKSSGASAGYNKYSSVLRGNSRQGPQSEGIDKLSEFDGFLKEKKQYITINRNRGVKKTSNNEDDEEREEVVSNSSTESNEDETEEENVSVKSTRRPLGASTPAYSTIRRTRPSTTTEATQEEEQEITERKSYSTLNRSRARGTTTTELPDATEVTPRTSRYKYLERSRPTRPSTQSSNKAADEGNDDDDDDIESENQENTVHFKAVNIENTRETQQEITTNTQRTYASIGRRTTTTSSTPTATPETTTSAAKTTTITTATPTTSTTETPLTTTPLTILESTTPESILITTNIPITTTTNPNTPSTSLPIGEDVLESLASTTPNTNEISFNISEKSNSLLTDSSSFSSISSSSIPSPSTESGLDTNEQEIDSQLTTTTETTLSSTTTAINDSDNLTKTEQDTEQQQEEEVNVVSKQRNKTLYSTRTRTTTTTTPTTPPSTKTTETTSSSSTNAKKTLGVRRQQILLNRSSQTKTTSTVTTTDTPITTTTESVNNDFLGTVSSPRPFGFPKRRNRPTTSSGATTTTTEETVKPNDETLVTKQKTTKLNAAANSQIKVSSQNSILSQTASVHEAETSSQQEHILQEESEVTSTEHLNSKVDTKVEHLNKNVLIDVDDDGIEGNNVNSLRHDYNLINSNNTVDSSSSSNNNTKIITHTIVHEVDDDDDRQPTKPTPKKKKLVVTEVTTEERIRQKVDPDHVTIVNDLESNEKDSRFSKKQDEVSKETGKYRGKSLEESVENANVEENHVDGEEEEGRAFRTYTTINRRRQQTTGIGNDINSAGKSDEEEHENDFRTKVQYQTITRGQTTKAITEEINENNLKSSVNRGSSTVEISTEDSDDKQTKKKYTQITRSHQGSQENHKANENSGNISENSQESEDNLKTKFKYTTITRGSNSKTVSGSDDEVNESNGNSKTSSKYEYTTLNRGHGTDLNDNTKSTLQYTKIIRDHIQHDDDDDEEAENVNGRNYSTPKRNNVSEGLQSNTEEHHFTSTESGNEKRTYTTISRNRGSGSTTENIPYKAIVRNSQGVRLTDEELSGFVKNAGDLASKEEKRTYLTMSRGGQILQNERNAETEDEHFKTNSMEAMSLTEIETTTENEEEHSEKEHGTDVGEENSSKTKLKYQTITRGQTSTSDTEDSEDVLSSQENGEEIKTRYITLNRGSSKDDLLTIEAESTTTEAISTTTELTTTSTTEEPTTTTERLVLTESSTEYVESETTPPTTTETNTKESESNIEKSNESTSEVKFKNEEQKVTSTQTGTGRRRVVFRKRPTSQATINQETVNVKHESILTNTKEVSEESNGSSRAQTSFRRHPTAGRRPATDDNKNEETKLKFDHGSLINTETENVEEDLETTTRATNLLPRATYRPKDKADLSSLLALDLARKYNNNNNQQQFGVGSRRRPVIKTQQVTDEIEEDNSSKTRTSGSISEEVTTESETINGSTRTAINKKGIFTSKTSDNGDVNTSETIEQTEIQSGTGIKGDTEGLHKVSLDAGELSKKHGTKYQFSLGSASRKRLEGQSSAQDEVSEKSRTTSSNNQQTSSETQTVNGRRRTIIRKRVQTNKSTLGGNVPGLGITQTSASYFEGNSETNLQQAGSNGNELSNSSEKLSSAADSTLTNIENSSSSSGLTYGKSENETQTENGRRRTIIRKRIQTNKSTLGGNASGLGITRTSTSYLEGNSETNLQQTGSNGNELSNSSEKLSSVAGSTLTNIENSSLSSEGSGLTSKKSENETSEEGNSSANSDSDSKYNFKSRQSTTNTYSTLNRKNAFANKRITGSQSDQQKTEAQSNRYGTLNRQNVFVNKRVSGSQSEQNKQGETETESESYETIEEISEEDQNSYNNNISSGSNYQTRNTLSSQNQGNSRRTSYSGQRGSVGSRTPTKPEKYEEVEILEDGSKRIKTIYIETKVVDGKIKTIRRIRTKTIIKQAPEYEYENEEFSTTTTTRRPIPRNRGSARFQSSDLSSLLALDLASKALRREQEDQSPGKSRRKLIRKPVIVKEEEHVEEFEEELPTRPVRPQPVTTESSQVTSRRTRPTRPFRTTTTTTTTKAPQIEQEEVPEAKNVVSTTRRNFAFKRPAGTTSRTTTTKTTITKGTVEETKSAAKSKFTIRRPAGTIKTSTTTSDEITKTLVSQNEEQINEAINRFKTKTSRADTTEEFSSTTSKPETTTTTTTVKIETTSPESTTEQAMETIAHGDLENDSLDLLKNQFANAVRNLQTETEKVTKTEVIDALETKNAITSGLKNGQDLSLPIYHRRKYYQYYKDSPITYINPITIPPKTAIETNVDIAKQIHDVFNVSNDHLDPEPELTDELVAIKAMEQAQEINSELSHFLLKTPGSN